MSMIVTSDPVLQYSFVIYEIKWKQQGQNWTIYFLNRISGVNNDSSNKYLFTKSYGIQLANLRTSMN